VHPNQTRRRERVSAASYVQEAARGLRRAAVEPLCEGVALKVSDPFQGFRALDHRVTYAAALRGAGRAVILCIDPGGHE
jgi:hypothetical protein